MNSNVSRRAAHISFNKAKWCTVLSLLKPLSFWFLFCLQLHEFHAFSLTSSLTKRQAVTVLNIPVIWGTHWCRLYDVRTYKQWGRSTGICITGISRDDLYFSGHRVCLTMGKICAWRLVFKTPAWSVQNTNTVKKEPVFKNQNLPHLFNF